MPVRYAYSFDRQTFVGGFDSRSEALRAAIAAATQLADVPTEVYVGVKVEGDSQVTGHAEAVIRSMSERARSARNGTDQYLRQINEHEEAELDEMLAGTITKWLATHDLMPKFFCIESISEHPVRQTRSIARRSEETEVSDIGVSEFPIGR